MLCDGDTARLSRRSSDYRTPPWGVTDQPPFFNAVIAVATSLPPHGLLACMQDTERALGRDRAHERRWGPRTIDLDLIGYDEAALNDATLTLPHPRLFERAFVLVPLAEIAPDVLISGVRVADALGGSMQAASRSSAPVAPSPQHRATRHATCTRKSVDLWVYWPTRPLMAFCSNDGRGHPDIGCRFPPGDAG